METHKSVEVGETNNVSKHRETFDENLMNLLEKWEKSVVIACKNETAHTFAEFGLERLDDIHDTRRS